LFTELFNVLSSLNNRLYSRGTWIESRLVDSCIILVKYDPKNSSSGNIKRFLSILNRVFWNDISKYSTFGSILIRSNKELNCEENIMGKQENSV
jgi:hypothetical protein